MRQTSMPPVGFEPAIPARARPQTYALDRTATGIGCGEVNPEMSPKILDTHLIFQILRGRCLNSVADISSSNKKPSVGSQTSFFPHHHSLPSVIICDIVLRFWRLCSAGTYICRPTNVSEEHIASIVRVEDLPILKIEIGDCFSQTLLSLSQNTQQHFVKL
jgi:hypothetical protein